LSPPSEKLLEEKKTDVLSYKDDTRIAVEAPDVATLISLL
jgi:hypothetical protein